MGEILKVEKLCFGYGKEDFLKNISFSVNEGEFISVIGENGSGKSTLFKTINGIFENYKGDVFYKGKNIKYINSLEKAKEIAVLYQNTSCKFPFNCFETVMMGLYPHKGCFGKVKKEDIDFVSLIMEKTDTLKFAYKKLNELSGGQAQRVLLAKALCQKPKLLFLDEAMSGLDISAEIEMNEILHNECKSRNMTVVNIQHNINMAFEKSDKIVALKNGGVYSFGKPSDLLNKDFFREVFNVEVEISNNKYFRIIIN